MDYLKAVQDKKAELSSLHSRMDTDRELVELSKYKLKDVNGKDVPNSISITLNDPAVFAANVESSLGSASEQVVVESEDKKLDTAYIEDFIRATLASANSRLVSQGRFPLNPFLDQQMCRRGRGATRCLFRKDVKTGQVIPDLAPWDTRFVYSAMGVDGLDWVAYETTRSKDVIEAEYPGVEVSGTEASVLDIWGKDINEVHVAEIKAFEQANPHGYPPVVMQLVPMGSMLADKDSLSHQGESIFFLIRDLVPELNRLVSIIQSLNMKALDSALLWKSKEGIEATPPKHKDLTSPGSVTTADIGGGAEPVSYGEIKRSAYLLHSMIEQRIQRGSLSNVDLGTLDFQLSAVALIEIGEGRDQVFLPRLGARGLLKQQLAEMIIAQVINMGESSVEIGTHGHKRVFDVRKLQGEYEISFKYFIKQPKVDAARWSIAAAAGNLCSAHTKRRDIVQMEDPEAEEDWLRYEEAEMISPAVKMRRTIKTLLKLAEKGDEDAEAEARLMADQLGVTVEQMLSGSAEQIPKPTEAQEPQPTVPLLGGGGRASSAQKSAQLQAEPRESEGGE